MLLSFPRDSHTQSVHKHFTELRCLTDEDNPQPAWFSAQKPGCLVLSSLHSRLRHGVRFQCLVSPYDPVQRAPSPPPGMYESLLQCHHVHPEAGCGVRARAVLRRLPGEPPGPEATRVQRSGPDAGRAARPGGLLVPAAADAAAPRLARWRCHRLPTSVRNARPRAGSSAINYLSAEKQSDQDTRVRC